MDAETKQAWEYLLEVLAAYEEYVSNIGNLGLSAPNLLYYRDEVQEFLDMFKTNKEVDFRGAWEKTKVLDEVVKKKAQELVDEIGHANFRQYYIMNDPPKAHWWWYLNRVTSAPAAPPKVWEFWKWSAQTVESEGEAESE
ncbi:MAG: hypothetical protein KC910_23465 [Candidatus Eremiobacteraeota bacterium]|nr:hypothetical protein [Candidatus Eremiobacteraeota bacterium]